MNIQLPFITFKRTSLTWLILMATASLLLISGCATAPQKTVTKTKEYVWPEPPEQAVIKYLHQFSSAAIFASEKKLSWKDALVGEAEDEQFISLRTPYGVHVDNQGRIYVADTNMPGLAIFDFEKEAFSMLGTDGPGELKQPINASSDRLGRIYVADGQRQNVFVYNSDGEFLNTLGSNDEFEKPVGLAVDNERERIYVSDSLKHHIAVFNFDGERVSTIGKRGMDPGWFNFPLSMAIDSVGRLYVVDSMNFRIQIIDPDSEATISTIGEQGQRLGQFTRLKGIAVDSDDNIYVTDTAFANVQIFNSDGQLLMIIGKAGTGPGGFNFIAGLTIDAQDRLYVADQGNQRIQVFQYLGAPMNIETEQPVSE